MLKLVKSQDASMLLKSYKGMGKFIAYLAPEFKRRR